MKHIFYLLLILTIMSCNNNSQPQSTPTVVDEKSIENTVNSEPLGLTIINESDCNTCHQTDQRLIGPSYLEIVERYPYSTFNAEQLIASIKNGGRGKWGDVEMPPHPILQQEEIEVIVEYIYSLNP